MDTFILGNAHIDAYIRTAGLNYRSDDKPTEEMIRTQMKQELIKVDKLLKRGTAEYEIQDFNDFLICCTLYICLGMHKMQPQYAKALKAYECPVVAIANIDKEDIQKAIKDECFNMNIKFISYSYMLQNIPPGMEESHPYVETFRLCSDRRFSNDPEEVHIRIEFEPNDEEAFWRDDVISYEYAIRFFKNVNVNHCCFNDKCNKEATKRCIVCQEAWYCSVECQRLNWKEHKTNCHAKNGSETLL